MLAVLLGSHAQPLKAMTMTGSDFASWLEEGKNEVCGLVEPVPQLLLSLPKLDWYQLLTSTELHLLRDSLNPDARHTDLYDVPTWFPWNFKALISTESLLITKHYFEPETGAYFVQHRDFEGEKLNRFWLKGLPVPAAVYPTLLMKISQTEEIRQRGAIPALENIPATPPQKP